MTNTTLVVETTDEKLEDLRESILAELGTDLEHFRARVASGVLNGDEWGALFELDSIAFLLGEPPVSADQ